MLRDAGVDSIEGGFVALRLSRRRLLEVGALLGAGAASALLAACGSTNAPAATTAAVPTATTGTGSTGGSSGTAAATTSTASSATTETSGSSSASVTLASDQTFRYPYYEPVTMDPGLANTEIQIMMNVWEGLVGFDQQNQAIPRGAERWDVSSDGTVYTFHLRGGVKWTDGTTLTAHDYEWTWKRNLDPKTASVYANALYSIKNAQAFNKGTATVDQVGVKAVDDATLQVTLEGPAGYFLRIASTWTALPLPQQSITKYSAKWTDAANIVSNGPFKMAGWQHDSQMTLARNDDYWGQKPTLSKIAITITSDPTKTDLAAYENNELDLAFGPWPSDIDRIQKDATLSKELHIFPNSATVFVVCDATNPTGPTGKVAFRKALYLAVEREKIVTDVFKNVGVVAYTMLPTDILGNNPNAKLQGTVQDAQNLLSQAGFPGGKGVPELTMSYVQGSTYDLLVQVLQQMWSQNLGIKVNLNAMESKAFYAYRGTLKDKHFDLMLNSWGSDYLDPFDWFNFLFMSNTDYYHSHWANTDFDKLVSQAAVETDQGKRGQLYQQAEVLLMTDMPNVTLYHSATPYLIKPWVSGYVHNAVGGDPWSPIQISQH